MEREVEGFKKYSVGKSNNDGLRQGEKDEICEHIKCACYTLGLSNTQKKMTCELGLEDCIRFQLMEKKGKDTEV